MHSAICIWEDQTDQMHRSVVSRLIVSVTTWSGVNLPSGTWNMVFSGGIGEAACVATFGKTVWFIEYAWAHHTLCEMWMIAAMYLRIRNLATCAMTVRTKSELKFPCVTVEWIVEYFFTGSTSRDNFQRENCNKWSDLRVAGQLQGWLIYDEPRLCSGHALTKLIIVIIK